MLLFNDSAFKNPTAATQAVSTCGPFQTEAQVLTGAGNVSSAAATNEECRRLELAGFEIRLGGWQKC